MHNAKQNVLAKHLGSLAAAIALAAIAAGSADAAEKSFAPEQILFFEKEVRPLLEANCFKCHGGEAKIKGGLRMTTRVGLMKGGQQGPSINIEKPEQSLLLEMLTFKDEEHSMPPKGKLPQAQIDVITKWVAMGAPWTPGEDKDPRAVAHEGPKTVKPEDWWAYKPLARPPAPQVKAQQWVKNPIDAFILYHLEQKGLNPVAPAARTALIRRVYYDLIGLPPTPSEVDAFLKDTDPAAYEKLLDRLLAMPQYGEKWGRHWLDLVRYAETNGYERDGTKPHIWRYRDYVIRAFNEDKPYDQFIREQIAGDELDSVTPDSLVATGFYRLGVWDDEPADRKLAKYDVLDGIVSTTAQVFTATTVGCARCHDHKKDPILQKDYYSMLAFFQDVSDYGNDMMIRDISTGETKSQFEKKQREKANRESKLFSDIFKIEETFKVELVKKDKNIQVDALPVSDITELSYRFYRDTWNRIPKFDTLRPEAEGVLASNYFSTSPASRNEAIGLVFDGKLNVPEDGKYTFVLDTKDNARLTIDGAIVVEHDMKGRRRVENTATLQKGLRPIRLEYVNVKDTPVLNVSWSGATFKNRGLSDSAANAAGVDVLADSRKSGQVWSYTTVAPAADWMNAAFDDKSWKKGAGGFGFGTPPGSVIRSEWNTPEIWLRKRFDVAQVPTKLLLNLHHDEDAEIYINGKRVHNVSGYTVKYESVPLSAEALAAFKTGANVIAVHCKQTGGGQYIDLGLSTQPETINIAELIKQHGEKAMGKAKLDEYFALKAELEKSRAFKMEKGGELALTVAEAGRSPTKIFLRGNPNLEGDDVKPGFPAVLDAKPVVLPAPKPGSATTGKRRVLAEWLASKENKMTARTMVNRLWQYHFGRGIVRSSNDFGQLGELPTHPDLLDWLATEFTARDWKIKSMHKLIMMSSTYQMSSQDDLAALAKDPNNDLFWRFDMRRMTAEEIRDSILAVNGTLNPKMGGPSIFTEVPQEVLATSSQPTKVWGKSPPDEQVRRSVYIHVKRSLVEPILNTFDLADTDSSCAARFATTVPTQALTSLNSKFFNVQAELLAKRLRKEAGASVSDQVKLALRLTLSREAKPAEIQRGIAMIDRLQKEDGLNADKALDYFCLVALNLNEFVYLD